MSSHDSKPQFSLDSFDDPDLDDIAELFDAFEQGSQPVDPHLEQWVKETDETDTEESPSNLDDKEVTDELDWDDDLVNLFDDNPSQTAANPPIDDPLPSSRERVTFSSLPSEEEISELFGELDWDSPAKTSQVSPSSAKSEESDDELLALFEDDGADKQENRNDTPQEPELDQLKSLLTDESDPSDLPVSESVIDKPSSSDEIPIPVFYEVIEELTDLLEQSTYPEPIPDFAALEALIDAPACLNESTEENLSETASSPTQDRAWDDMEALAMKVGHKMSPSASPSPMAASPANASRPSKLKGFEETVRVSVKQLDNLSNLIGELVVKRNRLEQDQERLRQFLDNLLNHVQNLSDVGGRMQDLYERTLLEGALLASRATVRPNPNTVTSLEEGTLTQPPSSISEETNQDLDALEMDRFTGFHLLSQEMIELIVRVREATSDIQFLVDETDQVGRSLRQTTTQLQEGMTKTRMVPFGPSADRLVRPVRDISRQLKKQARLNVEGKDVLIDKMILEHLSSPLTHLVNNAVTHGIETIEERRHKGKSPEGHINIRAFLQGNQTVITFADDGGGIDPEKIKKKAIEKKLVSREEALALSESEIYDFLFHPGFSTKDQADRGD